MIHICVLLYVLIAPFGYTLEIQEELIGHEIPELFRNTREAVPGYEVISVTHSLHKRSTNDLSIKAKINGAEREIILQSVESFFAGKDTIVSLAKKINGKFKYTLLKGIMEKVNMTFYQDKETRSTISHRVNKRGISEFSGIIDADKVISPLKNYIRKRRDVSSESLHEFDNDNDNNYHVIYQKRKTPLNEGNNINYLDFHKSRQRIKKSTAGNSGTAYPEILVYVDSTLFNYFNNDIVKTVAYTLTLWNGVDLNFRELENPQVRLYIAGIVLCQSQIVSNDPFVITDEKLTEFSEFMYNENQFKLKEDYDIAVLLGADSTFIRGRAGTANTPGSCSSNTFGKTIESTALMLDDTKFSGIEIASHELAHLFGAPHDGEEAAAACSPHEGFIMSYENNDQKQFYFSQCSKRIMSNFFSSPEAACLFNNPAVNRNDKQILRILPGKYMTIDEQCQKRGLLKAHKVNPSICIKIMCSESSSSSFRIFKIPALEGTPCDLEKFCLRGECVKVNFDETDEKSRSQILFPPYYQLPGVNKSARKQCEQKGLTNLFKTYFVTCKLHCKYTVSGQTSQTFKEIDTAEDGTLCNNNGYCRDGECVPDPNGLVTKRTISTTPKSMINSNGITSSLVGLKLEHQPNLNVTTTPVSFARSVGLTTKAPQPSSSNRFNLADAECKKAKLLGALQMSSNTCVLRCKLFPSDFLKKHLSPNDSDLISQTIVASNGFPCGDNKYCQGGECFTLLEMAHKECNNSGAFSALEIFSTDCVIHCKLFPSNFLDNFLSDDDTDLTRKTIFAPNGFPCSNNGICSNKICTH